MALLKLYWVFDFYILECSVVKLLGGRVATVVCRQIVDTVQFAVVCGCGFSGSVCGRVRARSSSCLASECNQACIVN